MCVLYTDLLKTQTTCPFCDPIENEVIEKNTSGFLTYSIAPYHKHHLMVIPFRHVDDFKDLSEEETVGLQKLLHRGVLLIGDLDHKGEERIVMTKEEIAQLMRELREASTK